MADGSAPKRLEVPAVTAIKHDEVSNKPAYRGQMERTLSSTSAGIREQGNDLKEAAEQSLNVILDLTVEGKIRWASPAWQDVVGIPFDSVQGKPISDILAENQSVFSDAIEEMRKDDSGSKNIRFTVRLQQNAAKPNADKETQQDDAGEDKEQDEEPGLVDLEAQGIMVYDKSADEECHTMWMIRPFVLREVTIDLPSILVESLGVGAEMLAQHLTNLAESGAQDPKNNPPPLPVLCRICERQITPWWFPKHTELCMQEHQAEADLQMAQDTLTDHRSALVKVLDALEVQMRHKSRSSSDGEHVSVHAPPAAEYKGMEIGTYSSPSSGHSSGVASPAGIRSSSRDRSISHLSHSRGRSFAVRRPLARIVELVLDLCDTALEINTPALKESKGSEDTEIRTQSPQSEGRINQVLQWQSPSQGALEHEAGLIALCDDTYRLSRAKVDSILMYRRILEYSERIRTELIDLVQECIDAALEKAARIAAGEISSDSDSTGEAEQIDENEEQGADETPQGGPGAILPSFDGHAAVTQALHEGSYYTSPSPPPSPRGLMSSSLSTRSSSPKGCPTPKSYSGNYSQAHRASITTDTDPGGESDASGASSIRSRARRAASPSSEVSLSRTGTGHSRERKRSSLVLSRAISTSRQHSPARSSGPASPLRVTKPRFPSGPAHEDAKSPVMSPTLSSSEFHSPVIPAQLSNHRRQSSAASSEMSRAAVSPRLSMSSNLPPRAVPPSIRDFEIIKPISKGAFGSVYLSKKKTTGDYYAIKALKKADMVAKNQVANVKAERAILMWQGESDFVAKLYWTFPSKDYIFLVMEYLNGGDCASLVQALSTLPEDWAKRYMAEVVQGVEHLHSRGIVHRDLKPDNLLIDQKGHLKLTDFGLSRMGLIGRQKRALSKTNTTVPDPLKQGPLQRSVSMTSSRSASFDVQGHQSPSLTPSMTPVIPHEAGQPSYFSLSRDTPTSKEYPSRDSTRQSSGHQSDVLDAEQLSSAFRRFSLYDEPWTGPKDSPKEEEDSADGYPLHSVTSSSSNQRVSTPPQAAPMPPPPMALFDPEDSNRRFVGTPDYLAPETINGLGQDEMSDWWSLGCILFEFLFGYPPFHADAPDKVFDNILNRRIDWPPEEVLSEVSDEVKDIMNRLMSLDPSTRLGSNIGEEYSSGGEEIRRHCWFSDIDWDNLNEAEPSFVPAPENIEDTEYFDTRGAATQDFAAEFDDQNPQASTPPGNAFERPHDALAKVRTQVNSMKRGLMPLHIPAHVRDNRSRRSSEPMGSDDFGQFSFKNLPVLEKANKDVIQKLRNEAMQAQSRSAQGGGTPVSATNPSPPSLEGSPVLAAPIRRALSTSRGGHRSASPSSHHVPNPSPGRTSQPSSPLVQFSAGGNERRKTSSGSSSMSRTSTSLQPGGFFDAARLSASSRVMPSNSSSPVKPARTPGPELESSSADTTATSPRARSHTIGSNESREFIREGMSNHQKRRSQVFDVSPSSSDTEDPRQKALLRVHRRRQSSRRLSQISLSEGPMFRPLDVLVCEDHPVSRLVMEKLLEKLRCRAIIVQNGPDAMRYALSSVKFDIIMMEFKLPQLNGADVARMIRDTKNENCHTPIVAVTGYLKELLAPHHFDALIEKPPTKTKLVDVMSKLCSWKEPPPGWAAASHVPLPVPQSSLRNESHNMDESPTSTSSGFVMGQSSSSYRGSSREDSMSSNSLFTDLDSVKGDMAPAEKQQQEAWHTDITGRIGGLGISDAHLSTEPGNTYQEAPHVIPSLTHQGSAPPTLDTEVRRQPSAEEVNANRKKILSVDTQELGGGEFGDDEDEELGNLNVRARSKSPRSKKPHPGASKLSTEMLRSDSHGSVTSTADSVIESKILPGSPTPSLSNSIIVEEIGEDGVASATTPPERFPLIPGTGDSAADIETTPRGMNQRHGSQITSHPILTGDIVESQHVHVEVHAPPTDQQMSEDPPAIPAVLEPADDDSNTERDAYRTPPEQTDDFSSSPNTPQISVQLLSPTKNTPPQIHKLDITDNATPERSLVDNEADPDPTPRARFHTET